MRQMQSEGTLQASGLLARSYRKALGERGLLVPLCARLSPASARAISEPPGPVSWTSAAWVLETTQALQLLAGREACRELGLAMSHDMVGGVLAPMAKTALALFGSTPANLYPRLGTYTALLMRGVDFTWTPTDPRGGTLAFRTEVPMNDGFAAVWEGAFLFLPEACGVKGAHVRAARFDAGGRSAQVTISW
ncbi:hypothetical protein FGE12_27855 [Aggregicoccus sp. 17bor-14]|uniref:hypothetical protein n=1 Tax=Myxococcaceae TaxID=31 RepID=UPI00129C589D|nr:MULTISPECIES: hypothetical protein [Myxococcaceae]MBF5046263.1 hypothetical protein [Simulacricoccus sp. 17bor-14]MRI91985.1 hypothetical protein [Aggregicoccus sp. 17bor-14]